MMIMINDASENQCIFVWIQIRIQIFVETVARRQKTKNIDSDK